VVLKVLKTVTVTKLRDIARIHKKQKMAKRNGRQQRWSH